MFGKRFLQSYFHIQDTKYEIQKMISKKEVQHIAKLARLGLAPKEIEKMKEELSSILDYIEKLKEVDISGIKATTHSIEIKNVFRQDKEREKLEAKKQENLLELAPDTKNGYLKVKSILK